MLGELGESVRVNEKEREREREREREDILADRALGMCLTLSPDLPCASAFRLCHIRCVRWLANHAVQLYARSAYAASSNAAS